jgi:pyruvate,water dikinase
MVVSFNEINPEDKMSAGGKGGMLAQLYQSGYPVPEGFVILPAGFSDEGLNKEAWQQVLIQLQHMRRGDSMAAFAVRSSALSEDSAQASFAGEFETILDVHTDEAIQAAIHTVQRSRRGERAMAYSLAKGMLAAHEMAVVVQRLVRADISGVLFTADPVTANHMQMVGNFVFGFGEELVSGEAEPYTFTMSKPKGQYQGPNELKRFARQLYNWLLALKRS